MGWNFEEYKPEENKGEGFDILEGVYKCSLIMKIGETQDGKKRYERELIVNEVIDGNGSPGRKLWKKFYIDQEDSMRKMFNDFHTAGIVVPRKEEDFDACLGSIADSDMYVRGAKFSPKEDFDGNVLAEEDRKVLQSQRVISLKAAEKAMKKNAMKAVSPSF